MVLTLATAARNAAADAVVDLLDAGAADPAGDLVIYDGATPLVTIPFNNPAFGAAAAGVATMDNTPQPSATAGATGTADNCEFRDRDNTVVMTGAVSTAGAEVNLNTTSITSGDTVTITDGTYTQPAS